MKVSNIRKVTTIYQQHRGLINTCIWGRKINFPGITEIAQIVIR